MGGRFDRIARTAAPETEGNMKQILLACMLLMPCTALAQWKCDTQYGVMYSARVPELPNDADRWYTTIIGDHSDPQVRQLVEWFNTNPDLRKLKATTHFHVLDVNSPMFSRYARSTGDTPCVRIQLADGTTIYQCSNRNLPLSSEALANSIASTCLRRNVQPQTNIHYHFTVPDQSQPDQPNPQPDKYTEPDVFDNSWPASRIWTLVIAGVASALGGIAWQWKKSYEE